MKESFERYLYAFSPPVAKKDKDYKKTRSEWDYFRFEDSDIKLIQDKAIEESRTYNHLNSKDIQKYIEAVKP